MIMLTTILAVVATIAAVSWVAAGLEEAEVRRCIRRRVRKIIQKNQNEG
jgi:hypothetical protein